MSKAGINVLKINGFSLIIIFFAAGVLKQILLTKQILSKLIVITQEIFERDFLF